MRTAVLLVAVNLVVGSVAATEPTSRPPCPESVNQVATEPDAIVVLKARLTRDNAYPWAPALRCLSFSSTLVHDIAISVEVREDHHSPGCRIGQAAPRVDSFLVFPLSDVILWQTVDGSYQSWCRFLQDRGAQPTR